MTNEELEKIWNQVPVDYYEKGTTSNPLKRYWHTEKINTFKKIVRGKQFKKILDVGCAGGYMANQISKIFPEAKITAVDIYDKTIKVAQKRYPHISFKVADAHKLPFKNDAFDLIICYETIEHVVNPMGVLKEMRRVLTKDGRALVVMDSGNWMFRIVWWICEKTICNVWQGAHLHPFNHLELGKTIKESGFKILKKQMSHFGMEVSFLLSKNP